MERTTDFAFFSCPICGEKPYIKTFDVNYGIAYCKGAFLKRHPMIRVDSGYCQPSELRKKLADGWNQSHWEPLNMLPIRINMELQAKGE